MVDWSNSIRLEHRVAQIITQQEINGVGFDKERAINYVNYLEELKQELYNSIRPLLNMEVIQPYKTSVTNPFLKKGGYAKTVNDWYGDDEYLVSGPFSRVLFEEPTLSKRDKIADQLLKLGWKPRYFTPSGRPQMVHDKQPCPSLLKIDGDIGKHLSLWFTYNHRQSQIQGWLNNPRLLIEDRLTAGANPCGTNTGRMRHSVVVNVPKANADKKTGELIWDIEKQKDIFGTQMRSLFIARDGYKLVGHDASGLELRMLAHYMGDDEYTEILLNGEIHSYNQELAGLPDRDAAKTFIYAFNYGAGDAKLGSIVGGTSSDGAELRERFLRRNKALGILIERVQKASERGYLIGLDGRKLWMRKNDRGKVAKNKALNTLLQGGGAIVMKTSMCYLDSWVKRYELDVRKVLDMHDEAQAEVWPDHVEKYSELAINSIIQTGKYFNLRCPLDAEAKVGDNWAETH